MKIEYRSKICLYSAVVLFVFLLFARDFFGISVSKWLFVVTAAGFLFLMEWKDAAGLMFFLLPLYVGLPGNYLTMLFLLRMIFAYRGFLLHVKGLAVTLLIALFLLAQGIFMNDLGLARLMMIVGIVFLFLLFSYREDMEIPRLLEMYSLGVASMALIMLFSTLRVYSFSDLLSAATRLGMGSVDFAETGAMRVGVDPNYMGLFAISSISVAVPLLWHRDVSRGRKIVIAFSVLSALAVAFIAMSRAFILMFGVWAVFMFISKRSMRKYMYVFLAAALILFLSNESVAALVKSAFGRFLESNFADGNGRNALFMSFWEQWLNSPTCFFFGVGMFDCNVHCMPLQYLFGGGIVLSSLMVLYAWYLLRARHSLVALSRSERWIPLLVTGGMSLTVPIATSLTFMFPIAVCLFSFESNE